MNWSLLDRLLDPMPPLSMDHLVTSSTKTRAYQQLGEDTQVDGDDEGAPEEAFQTRPKQTTATYL